MSDLFELVICESRSHSQYSPHMISDEYDRLVDVVVNRKLAVRPLAATVAAAAAVAEDSSVWFKTLL